MKFKKLRMIIVRKLKKEERVLKGMRKKLIGKKLDKTGKHKKQT